MRRIGLAVVLTLSLALTPLAGVTIMIAEKAVDMIRAGETHADIDRVRWDAVLAGAGGGGAEGVRVKIRDGGEQRRHGR
jgi:hypothetical protein